MDTHVISLAAATLSKRSSLADLRDRLASDLSLPEGRQRDMISALSSLARALGRPLNAILADPAIIRADIAPLTAAMAGFKPGRWRNVQSLVGAALACAGLVTVQGRIREKPTAAWLAALALLGDEIGSGFHLWRFARWCSSAEISPSAVCDEVVVAYERALADHSLVSEPKRAAREAARAWNEAVITHPTWPQQTLNVPDNRNVFAPSWDAYPASLLVDIEAWISRLTDRSPFNGRPGKRLSSRSAAGRRQQLRSYLGALVKSGVPPERLVDLAAAVHPERARIGLFYFWEKAGERATTYTYHLAQLVLMIGRHAGKLPKEQLAELEQMVPHLKPLGGRMTEKNVTRLRQLNDPMKMQLLLALPDTLLKRAQRLGTPTARIATEVQTAAMIGFLLHRPIRLKNLRDLRLGTHVLRDRRGLLHVRIPGSEVKNGVPLDFDLSRDCSALLTAYVDRYRPLLAREGCDFVFPGASADQPKSDHGTRTQIQRALADHVGIAFHPHAFRHLAAYIVLRENPDAHGLVQRILGHTSLHATMAFYSGLESDAAYRHLDGLIARRDTSQSSHGIGRR